MTEFDFVKLNGLGNDFVFIDDFSREIDFTDEQVRWMCDRRFGIGADGVILVRPSERPECVAYMHYINSDGTLAQMCGNGVRCFAKFLVDRGFVQAGAGSFVADTLAGPKPISFTVDEDEHLISATVDMGHPITDPTLVPTTLSATMETPLGAPLVGDAAIDSVWGPFRFTCISMGNPHAVCFIDDFGALPAELFVDANDRCLATMDIARIGAFYESHEVFPEKANIEFACIKDDGIHMRVFERGCGETLACGTGACATAVAACYTGRCGEYNDVILRGGTLHIEIDDQNHVMMSGAAAQSFEGTFVL